MNEKENKVDDNNQSKQEKRYSWIITIVICSLTVLMLAFLLGYIIESNKVNNLNQKIEEINKTWILQLNQKDKELEKKDILCEIECASIKVEKQKEILNEQVERVKAETKLRLYIDRYECSSSYIARYIRKYYPMIPNILINEISYSIHRVSAEEDIPVELIAAIIQIESAFNPMAISCKNARGLMQVMPFWAKHFGLDEVCDLHDVLIGIHTGVKVLKVHLKEQNNDLEMALYYYVNRDKKYVRSVNDAMAKITFFKHEKDGVDIATNNTTK